MVEEKRRLEYVDEIRVERMLWIREELQKSFY